MRATSPKPRSMPNAAASAEAVAVSLQPAAQAQDQSLRPARIRRRGDRLSARRPSGDAVQLAPGARRRRAHRPHPDQCRARRRDRDRRNRQEFCGDARSLSGGADRGHPRRRHPADPQPDQKTLRPLFGHVRGRGDPRRRADPGRHRADGSAARRRLRHPVRRRREPYRDRRARARPAGGARGSGIDRICAVRRDGGDRRRRGHRDHRPDAGNDRRVRGAPRRVGASSGAIWRACAGCRRRPATGSRSRSKPISNCRSSSIWRWPTARWGWGSSAPSFST